MIRTFAKFAREHLVETGKRIRLKHDVALFSRALDNLADLYGVQIHSTH